MDTRTKRDLALSLALVFAGLVGPLQKQPLWAACFAVLFVAMFGLYFYFFSQLRQETGDTQPGERSVAQNLVRFVVRFFLCAVIFVVALMALCFTVYLLHPAAPK